MAVPGCAKRRRPFGPEMGGIMDSQPHTGRFFSPLLENIRSNAADWKCRAALDSLPEWPFACILIGAPLTACTVGMQWAFWQSLARFLMTGRLPPSSALQMDELFVLGGFVGLIGGTFICVGFLGLLYRAASS